VAGRVDAGRQADQSAAGLQSALRGAQGTGSDADPDRALRRRKSVLDFVLDDARRINDTLGAPDRRKLDEYLSGLRDLERRIDSTRPTVATGGVRIARPVGIPADYREHLRLMADLLVLAFHAT
jgi:hypothetical protein